MADTEKKIPDLTGPEMKTRIRLADDQLDDVAGGFVEYAGYAKNQLIECPRCHKEAESDFVWWEEKAFQQNGYSCRACGFQFWVNGAGQYFDRDNHPIPFVPAKK